MKVLSEECVVLVAGSGGHLMQMHTLSRRIASDASIVWVTDRTPQSESLLANEEVIYLPYRAPRDVWGVVTNGVRLYKALRSRNFRTIYSTGAGVALSCLVPAVLLRARLTYIESATRVTGLSLTGRVLDRIPGVRRFVQYPHATNRKWKFAISVFDGFSVARKNNDLEPNSRLNVVVTVGANKEIGFRRLIDSLHSLLGNDHDVFWQYGPTKVDDLRLEGAESISSAEMQRRMELADVVICHAGTGSTLMALKSGKLPIVVPRRHSKGEHVDDHQVDLASFLETRNLAILRDPDSLQLKDFYHASNHIVTWIDDLPPVTMS